MQAHQDNQKPQSWSAHALLTMADERSERGEKNINSRHTKRAR